METKNLLIEQSLAPNGGEGLNLRELYVAVLRDTAYSMESVAAEFAAGRNDTQADITTSFYFLVQEAIMAQLTLNYPNAVWS